VRTHSSSFKLLPCSPPAVARHQCQHIAWTAQRPSHVMLSCCRNSCLEPRCLQSCLVPRVATQGSCGRDSIVCEDCGAALVGPLPVLGV